MNRGRTPLPMPGRARSVRTQARVLLWTLCAIAGSMSGAASDRGETGHEADAPAEATEAVTEAVARPELEAYVEMVRADVARDAGLAAEALARYQRARDRFQALATEHPLHMPGAVAYRIRYCEQEIEALRSADAARAATAAVESVREIRQLRLRVAELEAALQEAAVRSADPKTPTDPPPAPQ